MNVKFGNPNEVTNPHIQCLMSLTAITQTSVRKIYDFKEKLIMQSQAFDTMGNLKEINGYIRPTPEKVPSTCAY